MNIRTQGVLNYIKIQQRIFRLPMGDTRFSEGIVQGLALVEEYIKIYEKLEEKRDEDKK